ncbi:helix-turn-helix transcriptional regulator [Zhongshania borealis]|uniref:HTH cro/C1-type domain-containing protein n=1 Tax=Zhongshania borealis TaxID=889488 RepID=A0ABP7WEY3_9GAMM
MISEEITRIEERLKDLGLTKTEFAIALGAPEDNASSYYNNWRHRDLPKSRLSAAADFLNTTIEWITRGERKLSVATDSCPRQEIAIEYTRRMHADGFITACATVNDRNFFIVGMHEDMVQVTLSIVTVAGGIKAAAIKEMIELGVLSRRIKLSANEYDRFIRGMVSIDDLFKGGRESYWGRIEIITHDSIYTPEVRDRGGNYVELPSQIGVILELFKTQQIDLDDLITLEQIACRLAAKADYIAAKNAITQLALENREKKAAGK